MSSTYEVRLGSQGRLVIPAELRDRLGAEEGAIYVASVDASGALVLRTRQQSLAQLREAWAGQPGSATDELIKERRQAAAAE